MVTTIHHLLPLWQHRQHIACLFGAPKNSKTLVSQSLPFIHRKSTDYSETAKELRLFLNASVEYLGILVFVFADPLSDTLIQLSKATAMDSCAELQLQLSLLSTTARDVQVLFTRARELHNKVGLLNDYINEDFECKTRLLGASLFVSHGRQLVICPRVIFIDVSSSYYIHSVQLGLIVSFYR